jgi:hypothetical protein
MRRALSFRAVSPSAALDLRPGPFFPVATMSKVIPWLFLALIPACTPEWTAPPHPSPIPVKPNPGESSSDMAAFTTTAPAQTTPAAASSSKAPAHNKDKDKDTKDK